QPGPHRAAHSRKHDRRGRGRWSRDGRGRAPAGEEDIGCERDQFLRRPSQPVKVVETPAMIDAQIASDAPAQFLEALREGTVEGLGLALIRGQAAPQDADVPHSHALLCPRREWPRRRTAEKGDEIAPPHCRTCSKATLFGIQLPSSKQKIASSETGLNAPMCTAEIQSGACLRWVIFDRVQRRYLVGLFRFAPIADIPPAPTVPTFRQRQRL